LYNFYPCETLGGRHAFLMVSIHVKVPNHRQTFSMISPCSKMFSDCQVFSMVSIYLKMPKGNHTFSMISICSKMVGNH
jgi:hypothetical protein